MAAIRFHRWILGGCLLLLCAVAQVGHAQSAPDAHADSLRSLAHAAADAGEASDRWLELSRHYRKSNLDSTQACLDRATRSAKQSGDRDRQQRCNMSQAALKWMLGDLPAAESRYRQAVAYWQGKNDTLEVARCLLNLGTVCQTAHKDQQAATYLKTALRLAQAAGQQLIAAQAAGSIATVSFQMGQPDSIRKYSDVAEQGFLALNDSANLARVHHNLGFYYLELGMSYEARQPFLDALGYLEGSDEASLKGEVHETFGNLEFNVGNFQEAISHYLIARGHFMQLKWSKRIAGSNNTIGICFERLGRRATAKAYFTESYRLADSIQNPGIAAAAMSHLAGMDRTAGLYPSAIQKYQRAILLDQQAPQQSELHADYLGLSQCYLALDQLDSARYYIDRAFVEASQGKDVTLTAKTHLERAKLSMVEKQYSVAMTAIKAATEIYAEKKNAAGLQQAWALHSQCSEAMGDIQGALKAERMARQWQDSVQAFSAYTQLLALEAKYWSEKKQHSLEIAKQNEALQAKEAERALEASAKLSAQRNLLISALALTVVFGIVLYWTNAKRRKNQLERKLAELRMTALRAQMNPHFIFNALGSVQLLINTSAIREANLYLSKFAQLLRMTLERSGTEDSTLQDEIDALRLYIDLEALRFKFSYTLEVGEDIDAEALHFPTLLLQPIVENAVKHGLAAKPQAGQLKIAFDLQGKELRCVIEDNGVGRSGVKKRTPENAESRRSFGIQITQERLTLLQPSRSDRFKIIDLTDADGRPAGTRVELRLPLQPQ